MRIIEVRFTSWDKPYWFDPKKHQLEIGDNVIVKTDLGIEIGKVINIKEIKTEEIKREIKPILRKANLSDIEKVAQKKEHQEQDIKICQQLVNKSELPIKIVDIHYSFDSSRITFVFTANGRIDFRQLVKDLTHQFQKSIHLHQIGVRDEAKYKGEIGPCGRPLCCQNFLDKIGQVCSEFVNTQQVTHRGSERLTGLCSRLKCCLRYEQELYQKLSQNLPAIGSDFKTPQGKGKVVAWHTLKQTINVALDDNPERVVEVEI